MKRPSKTLSQFMIPVALNLGALGCEVKNTEGPTKSHSTIHQDAPDVSELTCDEMPLIRDREGLYGPSEMSAREGELPGEMMAHFKSHYYELMRALSDQHSTTDWGDLITLRTEEVCFPGDESDVDDLDEHNVRHLVDIPLNEACKFSYTGIVFDPGFGEFFPEVDDGGEKIGYRYDFNIESDEHSVRAHEFVWISASKNITIENLKKQFPDLGPEEDFSISRSCVWNYGLGEFFCELNVAYGGVNEDISIDVKTDISPEDIMEACEGLIRGTLSGIGEDTLLDLWEEQYEFGKSEDTGETDLPDLDNVPGLPGFPE